MEFNNFCSDFPYFLTKFSPILLKLVKSTTSSVIGVILKDRGGLLSCWIRVFLVIYCGSSDFFSSKKDKICNFSPLSSNLLDVDT